MRAFGYARITKEEQAGGFESIEDQTARIRDYAQSQRLKIVEVCFDEPIVATKGSARSAHLCSKSGFFKILDEAARRNCEFVVTTQFDRFNRPDMSFNPVDALEKKQLRLALVGEELYLKKKKATPKCVKTLSVAERLKKGREDGARAGYHQSGPAPFGYRRNYFDKSKLRQLELHPEEAPVVIMIFSQYLKLKSIAKVIKLLKKLGIKTRRRKNWSRAGISWLLKNDTYIGMVHFGEIRARGKHTPIIASIIYNKVQKKIRENNKRGGARKQRVHAN